MKAIKNIALYFLALGLTFTFCDLFMNITGVINLSNLDFSDKTGVDFKPNSEQIIFNEGFSIAQINSLGLRGPEITLEKPDNTFRIALMGDSFIEGLQVMDKNHLRFLLEEKLSKQTNKKIEVLNFGYSGSEFIDMYIRHQLKANDFKPDLVLYFVSANDMRPDLGDPLLPTIELINDSLIIDNHFDPTILNHYKFTKEIKQRSTLFKMLSNCKTIKNSKGLLPIFLDKLYPKNTIPTNNNKSVAKSPKKEDIHPVTKKIISLLNASQTIIINRKETKFPEELSQILERKEISIIELSPVFEQLKASDINPYYWKATRKTGHWNYTTHEAIANYLSKKLKVIL